MVRLVLVLAVISGCATVVCGFDPTSEATDACKAQYHAEAHARAQAEHDEDVARDNRGDAHAQRKIDGAKCDEGDAHACLAKATYDEAHGGSPAGAYEVACRANLAFGCYGAGRFAPDAVIALADEDRGCALGEKLACEEAARISPARAVAFHEAACALRDSHACSTAAFAYIYGAGVARDVTKGKGLADGACKMADKDGCSLVDEASAEAR